MRSWQERGRPYEGYEYTALTPHYFWDGKSHYWSGMAVRGVEDQNPENPACCQDLGIFERTEIRPDADHLERMRSGLRKRGLTHREAGRRMGLGETGVRSRLYGQMPFDRNDFQVMCRLSGVDPAGLDSVGRGEEE